MYTMRFLFFYDIYIICIYITVTFNNEIGKIGEKENQNKNTSRYIREKKMIAVITDHDRLYRR